MDWVETTGRTVEEAKGNALDQLGVDEHDAEFEVLEQPKTGLFGRLRAEARVRARVKPTSPRPKDDRRDRRRRSRSAASESAGDGGDGQDAPSVSVGAVAEGQVPRSSDMEPERGRQGQGVPDRGNDTRRDDPMSSSGEDPSSGGPRSSGSGVQRSSSGDDQRSASTNQRVYEVEIDLEEQGRIAQEFLQGLLQEFGLQAQLEVSRPDNEAVDVKLEGDGLGILIGPKGSTLSAIQDLTRTVVQRRSGAAQGRIQVDVAGYRQKRTEALVRFSEKVAADVHTTGQPVPLEPMTAADRRIVHDTVSKIDGVSTLSEGEEALRHVVIRPDRG